MTDHVDDRAGDFAADFSIELTPLAKRAIKDLPNNSQEKVFGLFRRLSKDPFLPERKKKRGGEGLFGVPLGSYRVFYSIHTKTKIVLIVWAGHHQTDYHRPKFWKKIR